MIRNSSRVFTIFGRMPGSEPELLRVRLQPSVLAWKKFKIAITGIQTRVPVNCFGSASSALLDFLLPTNL